jgi:hypothetical protein
MPFEVLCVIGTNSPMPGFAPGDYFYHTRLVAFYLNNPAPRQNDPTSNLLSESKGM